MTRDEMYYQAEEMIEEKRRSGADELNLRSMALKELPETIGQLTQLKWLSLQDNHLTALPENFCRLTKLQNLDLSYNDLVELPECLGSFSELRELRLHRNRLSALPKSLGNLVQLQSLDLSSNQLTEFPDGIDRLIRLLFLDLSFNQLSTLPQWIDKLTLLRLLNISHNKLVGLPETSGQFTELRSIFLSKNKITDIPDSWVPYARFIEIKDNPLNPELSAAYEEGRDAFEAYLRAGPRVALHEAKLILVGEGEVGKSSLLSALRGDIWLENRPTTHGIEIKTVMAIDPSSGTKITLNGWDFGGQRVYRPTHQLFFSAPAVYLVVWKPREGPQQGFVKEWIKLVKHRAPDAKILVVATHGGPQQRQPDIDRQELWDLFGRDTVTAFLHVESKPDNQGNMRGIDQLKEVIAQVAMSLPEMGRSVPKRWLDVREVLEATNKAYLPLKEVLELCSKHKMDENEARLFLTISHRLGHLIHYQHDPALSDIVILKPDWLATAISFVLDDKETRENNGIASFSRLNRLWNDPERKEEFRYPVHLHPLFLRLMERFDLSYKVALPTEPTDALSFWQQVKALLSTAVKGFDQVHKLSYTSLIAQLVSDTRPEEKFDKAWNFKASGDIQQVQICRIVDEKGQSATAEGLFYQLIVRLHKYSLGRTHYNDSVHWQRGLILDDEYNGRALLEYINNDVRITVQAPYPERFLAMLTEEVKYLVEIFWEGLRCDVMVPCVEPCGRNYPGTGLYNVRSLIESKQEGEPKYPCPNCNKWQDIDQLLRNAPAAQQDITALIFTEFGEVKAELAKARQQITYLGEKTMSRFDRLDDRTRRTLSRVDKTYTDLLKVFVDEAKEGPRLFSLVPVHANNFNPEDWVRAKFRLTLWCERSRLPLPALNGIESKKGVYEIELDRAWFKQAGPYLRLLTGTLSLVLPVASSSIKLVLSEASYRAIEEQLDFGKSIIEAVIGGGTMIGEFWNQVDTNTLEPGGVIHAKGSILRALHSLLKEKDPGFGGLVRVMNKRQEFLWVHERFAGEY